MSFNEWKKSRLEEICDIIDSLHKSPKYVNEGYPMIRVKDMEEGLLKLDNTAFVTKEVYEEFTKKHEPKKGDILFSRVGSYGITTLVNTDEKFCLGQNTVIMTNFNEKINNKFLYYSLISSLVKEQVERYVTGSTQKTISMKSIKDINIFLPEINEQNCIVDLLWSLDQKIEANNQINKTLEEMAQTIFKQWFVEFEFPNEDGEPYKSSGGEMVESGLGMIPKGWRVGVFRDYVETILGGDWGKEFSQGNYIKEVYCLRGADIPEVRVGRKGALPKRFILEKNYNNKKLKNGDLVVEISGGSPTQSTGRITYTTEDLLSKYDSDFVCTNFCRAITLENKQAMEYFFFYWQQLYDQNVFFQYENGTTGIKNLDINTFIDTFQIIKPSKLILEKYHKMIGILLKKIQINGDENIKLTEIRDTLLPKLMSGEIRVPINE